MIWESPLFVLPFILFALGALAFAGAAWRRSQTPGSLSFALLMLCLSVWLLAEGFEYSASSYSIKNFWAQFAILGIAWIGPLWLMFAVEYAYPDNNLHKQIGLWPWVIPVITVLLVFTSEYHPLIWITSVIDPGSPMLVQEPGLWCWVFTGYTYLLIVAGGVILVKGISRYPMVRRRQVGALIVAMILPWFIDIGLIASVEAQATINPTPAAIALTGIIAAWSLFRLGLFNPIPLAHQAILENIGEGYLVLDAKNQIVEMNSVARRFFGLEKAYVTGLSAVRLFKHYPEILKLLHASHAEHVELAIAGQPPRCLEANLTSWYEQGQRFAGRILLLHDISHRKKIEEKLRDSEQLHRLLINAAPIGIVQLDEKARIRYASPRLFEIFNITEETVVIGKSVLNWVHQADRKAVAEQLKGVLQGQAHQRSHEYRLIKGNGETFWGEVTAAPILDNNDQPRGILMIAREITHRKVLELRLQHNLEQQRFINDLLQILFHPADMDRALNEVLAQTGLFTGSSRVLLARISDSGATASVWVQWCDVGYDPHPLDETVINYLEMPVWQECLAKHGHVVGLLEAANQGNYPPNNGGLPVEIRNYMAAWAVRSLIAFPILGSESKQAGFLILEDCERPRKWTGNELDLIWSICRIISSAVAQKQSEEVVRRQHDLAEALRDTAHAMSSTLNLEDVLDCMMNNLERVVPHHSASIVLVDDDQNIQFKRFRGFSQKAIELVPNKMPMADFATFQTMANRHEPLIIPDVNSDARWHHWPGFEGPQSYIGAPIQSKGRLIGFINVDSIQKNFFTTDHADRLQVFADQAAMAIENARLYDAAQRRAEEMSTLYSIGLTLNTRLEMDQLLKTLLDQCRKVLPIDAFYVAVYDAERGLIHHPLFYDQGEYYKVEPHSIHDMPGLSGEVIRRGQTIYLPDLQDQDAVRNYHIMEAGGDPTRSYVGVPLIVRDQVIGLISMQSSEPYAYSAEQVRLFETIASQAAGMLDNARIFEQMRQMAITDMVTQLYTRRHFTSLGHSEVERALRYNRDLSVMMVDIDWFKHVNDTWGHAAGDIVLQAVAQCCQKALRSTDIIGRWGGEEFVIILPEADQQAACLIAERIRRNVSEMNINLSGNTIHVTVSLGVTTLMPGRTTLESLVDYADKALYMAKQGGRNQVCICP